MNEVGTEAHKEQVRKRIEEAWLSRAKNQQYGKPGSAKYKNSELEFFGGAMAALQAAYPMAGGGMTSYVPPSWVLSPMMGRNIVEVLK